MVQLKVVELIKHFPIRRGFFKRTVGYVHAVNRVSFELQKGKILGLCGESGCGKSTLGRMIARMLDPTAGQIWFNGENITKLQGKQLQTLRSEIQIIFQDPYSSLNPRMTVADNLKIPLIKGPLKLSEAQALDRIIESLDHVGMQENCLSRYPHQFSGGQQQRICLARGLSVRPKLIILDEVLSALDLSIQAQVLQLLRQLREKLELTMVFISHDLSSLGYLCDEIAVMYLGQIVEKGPIMPVFQNPRHPYTQALLGSMPDYPNAHLAPLIGEPSSCIDLPNGCVFHPRCRFAQPSCKINSPDRKISEEGCEYRCIL